MQCGEAPDLSRARRRHFFPSATKAAPEKSNNRGVDMNALAKWSVCAVIVGCILLMSAPAQAQNKRSFDTGTRTVTGVVNDHDGKPASGAVVLLKNNKTLQVRSYRTKDDGVYKFVGLSPNDNYELRAQLNGVSSGSKTLSQFDGRKETKIDLKLK